MLSALCSSIKAYFGHTNDSQNPVISLLTRKIPDFLSTIYKALFVPILILLIILLVNNFSELDSKLTVILIALLFMPLALLLSSSIKQWWNSFHKQDRLFFANIYMGLLLFVGLHCFSDVYIIREPREWATDWIISAQKQDLPNTEAVTPLVLLDIDEATYQKWEEPLITPRDKILDLIQHAVKSNAKVVVVDISVAKPANQDSTELDEADKQLVDYLQNYSQTCRAEAGIDKGAQCPQIILAKLLRESANRRNYREQIQSFLDDAVANSPNIHWATAEFLVENEYIIRRWDQLWTPTCTEGVNGRPEVLPSVSFLTSAFLLGVPAKGEQNNPLTTHPEQVKTYLQERFHQFQITNCPEAPSIPVQRGEYADLTVGEHSLSLTPYSSREYAINKRIFYKAEWHSDKQTITAPRIDIDGKQVPIVKKYSADLITRRGEPNKMRFLEQALEHAVVVISSSFEHAGNMYKTPIGEMPGSLVTINQIISLTQYGQIEPLHSVFQAVIVVLVVILMSAFFVCFNAVSIMFVSATIIVLGAYLSYILLQFGWWFNPAFSLIFQVYDVLSTYIKKVVE